MKKLFATILAAIGLGASPPSVVAQSMDGRARSATELQVELTGLALRIAKEGYGIKLDFSAASVQKVDAILGDFHKHYVKTGDESGLNGVALEFAAYLVTTIERNSERGRWERDPPQIGSDTFPFYWRSSTLFPYGWYLKRIYDGEGDDVWSKYQALVLSK